MKRTVLLITLALLAGCAHSDPWTRDDTALELIHVATVAVDGYMTAKIQDHPNIVEKGPLAGPVLGLNPSTSDTVMYFTTVAISHYFISRALPKGWRSIWQGVGIARHGLAINKGHQIGLFSQPCTTPVPKELSCAP